MYDVMVVGKYAHQCCIKILEVEDISGWYILMLLRLL